MSSGLTARGRYADVLLTQGELTLLMQAEPVNAAYITGVYAAASVLEGETTLSYRTISKEGAPITFHRYAGATQAQIRKIPILIAALPTVQSRSNIPFVPEDDYLGCWVPSLKDEGSELTYDLYQFTSQDFFQGFIGVMGIYQLDFRDYLLGAPFDNQAREYQVAGYIMRSNFA